MCELVLAEGVGLEATDVDGVKRSVVKGIGRDVHLFACAERHLCERYDGNGICEY